MIGYDGEFEPDMTVSVESYIGECGAREGVKLEEMVRITETDCALIANFPFEDELLRKTGVCPLILQDGFVFEFEVERRRDQRAGIRIGRRFEYPVGLPLFDHAAVAQHDQLI